MLPFVHKQFHFLQLTQCHSLSLKKLVLDGKVNSRLAISCLNSCRFFIFHLKFILTKLVKLYQVHEDYCCINYVKKYYNENHLWFSLYTNASAFSRISSSLLCAKELCFIVSKLKFPMVPKNLKFLKIWNTIALKYI